MKYAKLIIKLSLVLLILSRINAGQLCPTHLFNQKSQIEESLRSIDKIQSSFGQIVTLGQLNNFQVYNFANGAKENVSFIAMRKGIVSDLNFTIWVEEKAYNQTQLNNLNSENFLGVDLTQLKQDRDIVIDEIYRILNDYIITGIVKVFGNIPEITNATYDGLHILLYDIKDTFEIDGSYFGGYFNPDDVAISKINLLHMDINPLNPGGRKVIPQISRSDFFQTLAHELFHLKHYHAIGDSAWNNLSQWIQEGLAQFAIYRILKDAEFSSSQLILELPDKGPSQVPFYLSSPNVTHLNQNFINSPLPVEYYGLGYLFFTHLWKQSGINEIIRDKVFNEILKSEIKTIDTLKDLLKTNGLNFDSIYEQFVLFQYFSSQPFDFEFIKLLPESTLGEFKSEGPLNLSNTVESTIAKVQPYEVRYLPINNDTDELQRLQFRSMCPATFGSQCVSCNGAHDIKVIVLPERVKVRECSNSEDPFSCVLSLEHQSTVAQGTFINLTLPPGKSDIAFYSTQINNDQARACFNFSGSNALEQNNLPRFASGPLFDLTNNTLEMNFSIDDSDSSDAQFSLFIVPENGSPFYPKESISTQITTISIDQTYKLTWNFLEDIPRLYGSEIYLYLKDIDQNKLANPFRIKIFAEDQLQKQTSIMSVFPGWNMLALQPQFPNQTLAEGILSLSTQLNLDDCSFVYNKGKFLGYSLSQQSCIVNTDQAIFNEPMQWGQGIFTNLKDDSTQELLWNHIFLNRWKHNLSRGWNLKSVGLKSYPESKEIPPTVPIAFHYDAEKMIWQKLILFGKNPPIHISDQSDFSVLQAHWIYSLNNRAYISN